MGVPDRRSPVCTVRQAWVGWQLVWCGKVSSEVPEIDVPGAARPATAQVSTFEITFLQRGGDRREPAG